jgi:ABC-type glycerol-3-phosphate transport system permease component
MADIVRGERPTQKFLWKAIICPTVKLWATSTLIVIPAIVFALIASKHLVRGLTMGAVK